MRDNNHIEAWAQCLEIIKANIPEDGYKTWFAPIKPISLEGSTLILEVPSDFFREYIEEHFYMLLKKTLVRVIGQDVKLIYNVRVVGDAAIRTSGGRRDKPQNKDIADPRRAQEYKGSPWIVPGLNNRKIKVDPQLNVIYNFENFIEGDCNKIGRTAGITISDNPGRNAFNPLFIYGGPGLGKTHLAQAIGIAIKDKYPEKTVLYVPANRFQTQYMDAAGVNNKLTDFLHFYQSIDTLIIDDVHEFAEKKGTQNAFFQIFNHLHNMGKQLILTSDRPPVELQGLEQRILSRFKWGLSVELSQPDYATRLAILKAKSLREGVEVPDKVLEFIAHKVKANIRELEGTLFSLIATSTFSRKEMTLDMASNLVDKIVTDFPNELTVPKITDTVCNYFGLQADTLSSKTRKREIVQARQIAMYLSRNHTRLSLTAIGSMIGGKDHATVLHACNTVCDLIETDRTFRQYVSDIEKQLLAE